MRRISRGRVMQDHNPSAPSNSHALAGQDDPSAQRSFFSFLNILTVVLIFSLAIYWEWPAGLRLTMALLLVGILLAGFFSSYGSILCRCILPLLIGGISVEAYTVVHELSIAPDIVKFFTFDQQYTESFYSGIATLYAIITALALVKGIEDFDAMKQNVFDEAYKIGVISELTHYFNIDGDRGMREAVLGVRQKLLRYAQNVAAMRDQSIKSENLQLLRECRSDIAKLRPEDENDQYSLQIILAAHGELGTLRSKRINAVGEKIPRYLIAALWITAVGLILPFMAEPLMVPAKPPATGLIENELRFGQYYIIFLMGSLNSFLLLMLSDISDPFDGFWKVNLDPFKDLAATLAFDLHGDQQAGPVP
jgi:hypothetical protein